MSQVHDPISDLGPTTETQQITKFVDDVEIATYEKPMMDSATAWTRMAEDSKTHDITAILQRPVNVFDGEFNNSFSPVNLKFPDVILQKSANVVRKLDYFTYFRANVRAKLMFNATPFMSGKYWMFFAPFDSISNRGSRDGVLPNNTGFPGVEIDLATNAPVEIKIPYCAPLSHYNLLDTHSNMGELKIVSLNDIRSGETPVANGATFTIFAWFEDIELAMPTSLPVTVPTLRAQVASEEHAVTSGPSISGMAGSMASAASAIGGAIPTLGKFLRPVEWVSRAIGGAASALGWNKPTALDKNCPFVNVPAKGYTNADGIDLSSKICAMPDNGLTMENGLFSTDVDEMDISYVTSKSCIFRDNVDWNTTQTPGTQLFSFVVAPGICSGAQSKLDNTTLSFVTSMFRYWRGAIKYRLTIAKTAFHTGRLRITYHPGIYDTNAANRVNENAYNWILDLSVSSELEFEVPYIANVPWKETIAASYTSTNNWRKEKFSTGHISIEVLTELRASSTSVSTTCPLNFWISGGDDLAFAIPDFGNYTIQSPTALVALDDEIELKAQIFNQTSSGVEHNEQTQDSSASMFPISRMGPTTAEELTMGEKITSLRQLIKRFATVSTGRSYPYKDVFDSNYCLPGGLPLDGDQYLFNQLTLDPCYFGEATGSTVVNSQLVTLPARKEADGTFTESDFVAADHYPTQSPLYFVSYLYRFFRGGRRYKVATPSTNMLRAETSGFGPSVGSTDPGVAASQQLTSYVYEPNRPQDPLYIKRQWQVRENGALAGPQVSTFISRDTAPTFEHYVYPDLTGTSEFEVPYYAQTPISLVGEGTIADDEGPLVRRSRIDVRRSTDPRGMDRPVYNYYDDVTGPSSSAGPTGGGIRNCFGAYNLYEAAADDFTFGYLVGAPATRRNVNLP